MRQWIFCPRTRWIPAVLQGYMARMAENDVSALAVDVLSAGKEAMIRFEASDSDDDDYEE